MVNNNFTFSFDQALVIFTKAENAYLHLVSISQLLTVSGNFFK